MRPLWDKIKQIAQMDSREQTTASTLDPFIAHPGSAQALTPVTRAYHTTPSTIPSKGREGGIININATHESVTEPSKAVSIVRESSERHKGHWCTGAQKGPLAPQI